jgi:hypothetical protein
VFKVSDKHIPLLNPGANIYPLYLHPDYHLTRRWQELKRAFLTQHLDYLLLTLDAAEKECGLSPQGVLVWQRAAELLEEAKEKLRTEFGPPPASGAAS